MTQQPVTVYSTYLQEDVNTPEDIFPYKSCIAAHGPRELVASIHAFNPAIGASIGTNESQAIHGRYWQELRIQIHDLMPEIVDIVLKSIPGRWIRSTKTINTSTIPILRGSAGGWGMPLFEDPGDNSRSLTPSRFKELTLSRLSLIASNEALRDYFPQKQRRQSVQRFIGLEDTVSDTPLESGIHSIIKTAPMAYLIHELDIICISGQSVMAYITASMLITSIFILLRQCVRRYVRERGQWSAPY